MDAPHTTSHTPQATHHKPHRIWCNIHASTPKGFRSVLGQGNAELVFLGFAAGHLFVRDLVPDAECVAQLVRQRRLAEQPGLFEPVEIGKVAQACQSAELARWLEPGGVLRLWPK